MKIKHTDFENIDYFYFKKNGISEIKSGMNHILIRSQHRVYTFGDEEVGALGCVFKKKLSSPNESPTR